jgi:hypothetical protein
MRLVGGGLEVRGFDIRYPDGARFPGPDAGYCLKFGGLTGMRCWVCVTDEGLVEWEWVPAGTQNADPWQVGNLVASMLAGRSVDCAREVRLPPDISLKGAVGHHLKASGLDVSLNVYADDDRYETVSDIAVTDPSPHSDWTVYVTDNGAVSWLHDFWPDSTVPPPDSDPAQEDVERIAKTIVDAIALAVSRAIPALPGPNPLMER